MRQVLITGGANGLGACLTDYYVRNESCVTVLDLQTEDIPQNPGKIVFFPFDLAKFEENSLTPIDRPMDLVICNAGISISGNFTEIPHEKEKDVFAVNLFGHMQLTKYLLKNDLIKNNGRIAFIISASMFLPFPIALAYSASKSALDGFANALEAYVLGKQISITRIYPGPLNTEHYKYYSDTPTKNSRSPQRLVPSIVRGIEKRKRKVCPDPLSRTFRIFSYVAPRLLCKKTFNFYRNRLSP